jgi:hypothetical protein
MFNIEHAQATPVSLKEEEEEEEEEEELINGEIFEKNIVIKN